MALGLGLKVIRVKKVISTQHSYTKILGINPDFVEDEYFYLVLGKNRLLHSVLGLAVIRRWPAGVNRKRPGTSLFSSWIFISMN